MLSPSSHEISTLHTNKGNILAPFIEAEEERAYSKTQEPWLSGLACLTFTFIFVYDDCFLSLLSPRKHRRVPLHPALTPKLSDNVVLQHRSSSAPFAFLANARSLTDSTRFALPNSSPHSSGQHAKTGHSRAENGGGSRRSNRPDDWDDRNRPSTKTYEWSRGR